MLEEIKTFGLAVTTVEAEKLLGYASGTLKNYIHKGYVDKQYLRKSGSTWLISLEWIEEKINNK